MPPARFSHTSPSILPVVRSVCASSRGEPSSSRREGLPTMSPSSNFVRRANARLSVTTRPRGSSTATASATFSKARADAFSCSSSWTRSVTSWMKESRTKRSASWMRDPATSATNTLPSLRRWRMRLAMMSVDSMAPRKAATSSDGRMSRMVRCVNSSSVYPYARHAALLTASTRCVVSSKRMIGRGLPSKTARYRSSTDFAVPTYSSIRRCWRRRTR